MWNFTFHLDIHNISLRKIFRFSLREWAILDQILSVSSDALDLCECAVASLVVLEFWTIFQIDMITGTFKLNQLWWTINIVPLIGTSYCVCALCTSTIFVDLWVCVGVPSFFRVYRRSFFHLVWIHSIMKMQLFLLNLPG